jgi:hypothetical protein
MIISLMALGFVEDPITQYGLLCAIELLINNDIQKISQTPAAVSSGNIIVDPKFINASDFRLATGSPLIDIGVNNPLGGLTALDLEGLARVYSGTVDLGAYEFSLLLRDGFE